MFGKQNFIFTLKNKIYEKRYQINSGEADGAAGFGKASSHEDF